MLTPLQITKYQENYAVVYDELNMEKFCEITNSFQLDRTVPALKQHLGAKTKNVNC